MCSTSENLSNSDFYTKIRLSSDQFLSKGLNSGFCKKFGPSLLIESKVRGAFPLKIESGLYSGYLLLLRHSLHCKEIRG